MRVIGDHEDAIARDGHAAVGAAGRVSDEPFGSRTRVVPDLPSRSGVERVALIRARHIHHTVHHDRRHLQRRSVWKAEDPLRHEPTDSCSC